MDAHVIAAAVLRHSVEWLVEVGHEVNNPFESFRANSLALGGIVEQTEGLLDGGDHAAPPAIALGVLT